MAFIRTKRSSAGTVYQVVRSERHGKQVKQTVLASLGRHTTLEAAIAAEQRWITGWEECLQNIGSDPSVSKAARLAYARLARLEQARAETGLP